MKQTQSRTQANSNNSSNLQSFNSKMPSVGGISIAELAVLGAAGFVLWRNREKIVTLLEDNGIESPAFLSADLNDLIRSGASAATSAAIGASQNASASSSSTSSRSRRQDA